jgi:hypothetical protein
MTIQTQKEFLDSQKVEMPTRRERMRDALEEAVNRILTISCLNGEVPTKDWPGIYGFEKPIGLKNISARYATEILDRLEAIEKESET